MNPHDGELGRRAGGQVGRGLISSEEERGRGYGILGLVRDHAGELSSARQGFTGRLFPESVVEFPCCRHTIRIGIGSGLTFQDLRNGARPTVQIALP